MPRGVNYKEGSGDKEYMRDIRAYRRKILRFKNILQETGANERRNEVGEMIERSASDLIHKSKLRFNNKKECLELTNDSQPIIKEKMSRIDRTNTNSKVSRIDPLFYSDNNLHENSRQIRKCLVTGLDISMQKEDSKFLCASGIKFYKKYYPEIWLKLWQRLDPRWHGRDEDIQIREIHHSIRNEHFNEIHNTIRSINNVMSQPALFNQLELIRKDKLEVAGLLRNHCKQQ